MRSRLAGLCAASALAIVGLAATGAQASTILVDNPSFETLPADGLPLPCGTGCSYSEAAVPGWTSTNPATSGQFQPGSSSGNTTYFNSVPDGLTVAYSNFGSLSQTVSSLAEAGDTYLFTVDFGLRNDGYPDPGTAFLIVGGHSIAATGIAPTAGNWSTYTASYTATALDAGQPISLVLGSTAAQGDWDNVSLSAVPEPATWIGLLLGVFGLGVTLRRGRQRLAVAA